MLNTSPIFDNVYERKNIKVTFSDDCKYAYINNGETQIVVEGSFFKDVVAVLDRAIDNLDDDVADVVRWNTVSTALSEPYDKEEFAELL